MKKNPEYKENLDFIEETIRCLQDEEERLQVFQSDMEVRLLLLHILLNK